MNIITRFALCTCLYITVCNFSLAQGLGLPVSLSANSGQMVGRQPDAGAWTDPALNHNKLLQQQSGDGYYQLIGPYKVKGSSYLFGPRHKGDFFSNSETARNIFISYNTYNQEVEFYSTSNPDQSLIKVPGTLDSFIIYTDVSLGITDPLKFVYGTVLGSKDKNYYEEVYAGDRFRLYKKYKADIVYDQGNLAQPDLRQFDLQYEYYYTDTKSKGVKKIKPNLNSIVKEFKSEKDPSAVVNNEAFSINPEDALIKAFKYLNKNEKGF